MQKKAYGDIGHGEHGDPGAVSGSFVEHKMNIIMAAAWAERLRNYGWDVKLEEGNLEMGDSARAANAYGAGILLSWHVNAGGGDRGEVIMGWEDGTQKLADAVAAGLKKAGQSEVRTYKSKPNSKGTAEYFGILRMSTMPAVIVEPFFLDNPIDRSIGDTDEKLKNIGYCVADAIALTYGGSQKEDDQVSVKLKTGNQVALPRVNVIMEGKPIDKSVILNVDGKDTTYIPAIALRDTGMDVKWDDAARTVIIQKGK